MADQLKIKSLEALAHQGSDDDEREQGVKLRMDLTLYADTRAAGFTDELQRSVDFGAVSTLISEYLKRHSFRLLEAVAEHLTEEILMEIPQVDRVDLEVRRPGVSAGVPAESVSVAVSRAWHTVDLSLGSNVGDRQTYLLNAIRSIESNPRNRRVKRSGIIESKASAASGQSNFLNVAVEMQTLFTPKETLNYVRELESGAGRERRQNWGSRSLDIDILFYDDCVVAEEDLIIPHPEMQNRMFMLGPLSEICPGKLHPVFNKSVMRMRRELEHRQEKEKEAREKS